jgi:hypothetical protein
MHRGPVLDRSPPKTAAPPWRAPRPEPSAAQDPVPWAVLGLGIVLAPLFAVTPLLQYMGWFLASLVHELGHTAVAWFFGQPAYPAIRIDGHAAAFHSDQRIVLVVLVGACLLLLAYALRRQRRWFIAATVLAGLYPLLALTGVREVIHLLGGHLSEAVFGTIFLYRALSGGFTESPGERIAYATMGWYLLGRNVVLDGGLLFSESARSAYAGNGSFGLTNDYIRAARHLGWGLEGVGALMLLVTLCALPAAWWVWRLLDAPAPAIVRAAATEGRPGPRSRR